MTAASGSPEEDLAAGLDLRARGATAGALERLRRASQGLSHDHPSRAWLHVALGELELAGGDSGAAREELSRAMQIQREVSQGMADSVRVADELELSNGLACRLPLLEKVRSVPGWLTDPEADLLAAVTERAAPLAAGGRAALVELGSYCGKSTLAIAVTLRALAIPDARLVAIDPHDALEWSQSLDTHAALHATLERFGVAEIVDVVRASSLDVEWDRPIALLFVDALHGYEDVSGDAARFLGWVAPGGFAAFHDYSAAFPGVVQAVDEALRHESFDVAGRRDGLIVLRRSG